MGLVIDTDVWVLAEKAGGRLDLARWSHYGSAYMSAVPTSALLVGVERANTAQRRAQRGAFVENLLSAIPVLEFSLPVARRHARVLASLSKKSMTAGAQHALIAATAVHHGHALLARNVADFGIFAGLQVEALEAAS